MSLAQRFTKAATVALLGFFFMGFVQDDIIELEGMVNARRLDEKKLDATAFGETFRKGDYTNVRYTMLKGTQAKVVEVIQDKSDPENAAMKVKVTNGAHKNDVVWVYFNKDRPWMKLFKSAEETQDAQAAKRILTTRDGSGILDQLADDQYGDDRTDQEVLKDLLAKIHDVRQAEKAIGPEPRGCEREAPLPRRLSRSTSSTESPEDADLIVSTTSTNSETDYKAIPGLTTKQLNDQQLAKNATDRGGFLRLPANDLSRISPYFSPTDAGEDASRYLQPSGLVQSTDPSVSEAASEALAGVSTKSDWDKVVAIDRWVAGKLNYDIGYYNLWTQNIAPTNVPTDAKSVLEQSKTGGAAFCEGFSNLTAAMLRASNIPARVVYGSLVDPKAPIEVTDCNKPGHAWVEALVGTRWMSIDPTTDNGYMTGKAPNADYVKYSSPWLRSLDGQDFSQSHRRCATQNR